MRQYGETNVIIALLLIETVGDLVQQSHTLGTEGCHLLSRVRQARRTTGTNINLLLQCRNTARGAHIGRFVEKSLGRNVSFTVTKQTEQKSLF
jgi:hypothetical protein